MCVPQATSGIIYDMKAAMGASDTTRPASPCISVCTLDDDNVCVGCGRTLEQIGRWALMSREEQWAIVERLRSREMELKG